VYVCKAILDRTLSTEQPGLPTISPDAAEMPDLRGNSAPMARLSGSRLKPLAVALKVGPMVKRWERAALLIARLVVVFRPAAVASRPEPRAWMPLGAAAVTMRATDGV
jgi:hypothetical protein